MAAGQKRVQQRIDQVLRGRNPEELARQLAPQPESVTERMPGGAKSSPEAIERRWGVLPAIGASQAEVLDDWSRSHAEDFARNIEYFVGTVKVPVGLAGPLRINGLNARGDYYVPLATTEAALVASYCRGAMAITDAGGCAALLLNEGITRAPGFRFQDLRRAGQFVLWLTEHLPRLKTVGEATTRHGVLIDTSITVEASNVFVSFEFNTADASGQNMVTIATQAMFDDILANCPVKPREAYVEANMSGEKKATSLSFTRVRGRKVSADVTIPAALLKSRLHVTPTQMARYTAMSSAGAVISGAIGVNGHYANGLAALFIACGQDAACVAEAAVGLTRFEVNDDGSLYGSVTMPNLIVGTVGGGTGLPSQKACLEMMGLAGPDKAPALAEVCAALTLAGELSIVAALASGEFSRAHARLARGRSAAKAALGGVTPRG